MPDVTDNNPQTQASLNGQVAAPAPAQAPSIDPNEFARYRDEAKRYEELTGRLTKSELKELSDDDLALLQTIRKSKVAHKDVIGAIGTYQEEAERAQNTAGLTPKQIQELVDKQSSERFEKMWSERETKSKAEREYERLRDAQETAWAGIRKELGLPDQIPDDDLRGQLMDAALNGLKYQHLIKNGFYGDDHPLKGMVRPLAPETITSIKDFMSKSWESAVARKQIADAKKAVRTTATGSAGTGGEPDKNNNAESAEDADRRKVENVLKERMRRRAASTTSTSA